jgi:hypothetical protein
MTFRPVPENEVAAFRHYISTTPPNEWPSPHKVTHAFDAKPPWLSSKKSEAALRKVVRFAFDRGYSKGRLSSHDSEPTAEFEREQYAGPGEDDEPRFPAADNFPELVLVLKKLGLSPKQIEQCCRAVGEDQDAAMDETDPDVALREFLEAHSSLSEDEVETAIKLARKDRAGKTAAEDEPPPFSGRPRPGGKMDPIIHNAAMDARALAMDAVRKIPTDYVPPSALPRNRIDTSSRSMASWAARWPGAARIKQA